MGWNDRQDGWMHGRDRWDGWMNERDGMKIWDGRYIGDPWINGSVSELIN